VMGGSALLNAVENFRAAVRAEAAKRLGCAEDAVKVGDDKVTGTDGRALALKEFAGIAAEGFFLNKKHTWTYGAHAAHVAVDAKTGHVSILDYVAVEDVGRIINPLTLKGQVIGSLVQGLGGAFLEHLVYDEHGQLLTGSLMDYLLPTASDFPNLRSIATDEKPSPINPLGAKGAGEGGMIAAGGVTANAVANALADFGVEPRELPLSPPRVWELLNAAKQMPKQAAE